MNVADADTAQANEFRRLVESNPILAQAFMLWLIHKNEPQSLIRLALNDIFEPVEKKLNQVWIDRCLELYKTAPTVPGWGACRVTVSVG